MVVAAVVVAVAIVVAVAVAAVVAAVVAAATPVFAKNALSLFVTVNDSSYLCNC